MTARPVTARTGSASWVLKFSSRNSRLEAFEAGRRADFHSAKPDRLHRPNLPDFRQTGPKSAGRLASGRRRARSHRARFVVRETVDQHQVWHEPAFDKVANAISPFFLRSGIYLFLISFICLFYVLNAPLLLGHYDLGWHLAAGDLIRERNAIPLRDPWSFTHGDKPWLNLSWLWDALASATLQYAGFGGLVLSTVACGAAIAGILTAISLGYGASAIAVCVAVFLACLLYPAYEVAPNMYLAVAPNTCTMLFCVVFYRECLRRTRWFVLPVLMAFWANLHGGFLLGFFVIGVFCGAALLRASWADLRVLALAGIGCLAATFVNPLGWNIYAGAAATMGHFVQGNITEWRSYYDNIEIPGSIPGILYMLAFVALELRYRNSRPVPLEPRLVSWLFLWDCISSGTSLSSSSSRRRRWHFTSAACCLSVSAVATCGERCWPPASSVSAPCRWPICALRRRSRFRRCCRAKMPAICKSISQVGGS